MRSQVGYAVVSSGQTLSGAVGVDGAAVLGITAPGLTSGHVYLLGHDGVSSGQYYRAFAADGSAALGWAVGAGSAFLTTEVARGAVNLKLETENAQTDVRTFTVVSKF